MVQDQPAFIPHKTADAGLTQPVAHSPVAALAIGESAVPTVPAPPIPLATGAKPLPPAPAAPPSQEPPNEPPKMQQPLRSLSLEFTPDGAHDVKLRLSEREGNIHISLQGTDPSLAGRVREGVGDLVGSLAQAGYDAEAWAPGGEHQQQRPPEETRKSSRKTPGGGGGEEFNGILQQPVQEIS